jgi:hypothetical protein
MKQKKLMLGSLLLLAIGIVFLASNTEARFNSNGHGMGTMMRINGPFQHGIFDENIDKNQFPGKGIGWGFGRDHGMRDFNASDWNARMTQRKQQIQSTIDAAKQPLGLPTDATNDQVKDAIKAWIQKNLPILKAMKVFFLWPGSWGN